MRALFFKMEDPKSCLCVEEATVEEKLMMKEREKVLALTESMYIQFIHAN